MKVEISGTISIVEISMPSEGSGILYLSNGVEFASPSP